MARKHLHLLAILLTSTLSTMACPGESAIPPRRDLSVPSPDGQKTVDLAPVPNDGPSRVDHPVAVDAPDPCALFKLEGTNCSGGQSCPAGLQPTTEPGGACRCRVSCNPSKPSQCGGGACAHVCQQLYDAKGDPMPGIGSCYGEGGVGEGESCAPAACKKPLVCVGDTNETSFCRPTCTGPGTCLGFKMICAALGGATTQVCLPGGSTTGPSAGESCANNDDYCRQGLICDPAGKTCAKACNTDGAGGTGCGTGENCVKLEDTTAQVVVGYGCQ